MSTGKKNLFKIIILGDAGFVNNRFSHQYRATVGADFLAKEVVMEDRTIWDTAGQERFQSLGGAFYRGAETCVLVYDITNQKSFESLDSWRDEFLMQSSVKDPENFPFIVIGNKKDKENERKVTEMKSQQWAKSHGNTINFEASAKDATNVEQAFMAIAKAAIAHEKEEDVFFPTTVKLNQNNQKQIAKNDCPC